MNQFPGYDNINCLLYKPRINSNSVGSQQHCEEIKKRLGVTILRYVPIYLNKIHILESTPIKNIRLLYADVQN